jgi:hypothetical protein
MFACRFDAVESATTHQDPGCTASEGIQGLPIANTGYPYSSRGSELPLSCVYVRCVVRQTCSFVANCRSVGGQMLRLGPDGVSAPAIRVLTWLWGDGRNTYRPIASWAPMGDILFDKAPLIGGLPLAARGASDAGHLRRRQPDSFPFNTRRGVLDFSPGGARCRMRLKNSSRPTEIAEHS